EYYCQSFDSAGYILF
nr:immunoglobulin light chain junction region [Macaca mulatta]